MLGAEGLHQLCIGGAGGVVGGPGRDLVGFEGVQITAAGHVRIADRITTGAGPHEAALQPGQQRFILLGIDQVLIQLPRSTGKVREVIGRIPRGFGVEETTHRLIGESAARSVAPSSPDLHASARRWWLHGYAR